MADEALSLLVMSPAGTSTVVVPASGVLVLGRARECDVFIDDTRLSRKHAELRCSPGRVELVDLGSLNGCYVRDERLTANAPALVRIGDSVSLGSTLLLLQRTSAVGERPPRVWSHGYFEARVEEACARADGPFSVVRVRLAPVAHGTARETENAAAPTAIVAWLRSTDVVGTYAPHEYEVLMTRTSEEEAAERVAELTRALESTRARYAVAVSMYPRDGRSAGALVEHATDALREGGVSGSHPPLKPSIFPVGAIERLDRVLHRVAEGEINVLILGETGAGKEVLARRIHALSPRSRLPMVSFNCAALSESLFESELFGHEKGAFTGAVQAKPGLLESATGGIVFLDEVGELPLTLQAKLLRVIEQREVTRVGALRPRAIDVRFLAATNRNLEEEIARGRFREDLYFRLNGIALSLPPLRERIEEIEPLALGFVERGCKAMKRAKQPRLAPEALEALRRYRWPGNIRELRNVIERAVLLCSGAVITLEHLPMEKLGAMAAEAEAELARAAAPGGAAGDEKARIVAALEACVGNQSRAAERLGISRATLIRRLDEFGVPRPRKR